MSLKPIKRSDHNKMWMQPRRDRHKLIQPEYHLIVTEGTKTEPSYFKAMSTIINAKKLETINERKKPSNSAPGTMIHKLIEKLKPYLTSNN